MNHLIASVGKAAGSLRLTRLLRRFPKRPTRAAFMFVNGFVTIAVLAALAAVSGTPFVFPSLGPTAILLFVSPQLPSSSPRNVVYGHAIGIVCGYAALMATGLQHTPAAAAGVTPARIIAAALSLALTSALMVLADAAHPPAGATTLIISLGIITAPLQLVVIEAAVVLLVLQATVINRLAGVRYPIWRARSDAPE
jgi:CBS-domain-containing membrane protein